MTSSNDKLKAYDFDMNISILRDTINSYRGCRLGERIAEMKRIVKWFGICKNMEMLRNNKKREEHRQEVLDYAKKVIDSYDHQEALNDKKEMDLEIGDIITNALGSRLPYEITAIGRFSGDIFVQPLNVDNKGINSTWWSRKRMERSIAKGILTIKKKE